MSLKDPEMLSVGDLLLDSKNPRIPIEKQSLDQDALALYVASAYDAIAVAESIVAHAYFPSEPLIAIRKGSSTKYIVVEGNRRLASLKLLHSQKLRNQLPDEARWAGLDSKKAPKKVPVIVAGNRKEVAPIIGFRHISGIQPWDAYAKARYLADQVDSGLDFEDAAHDVGEKPVEVRASYRNYKVAEQISKLVDTDTLAALRENFGTFTRAMQAKPLRDFIGAPAPSAVRKIPNQIAASKKKELKELAGYLFGEEAVIADSRQLTMLGNVIGAPEGLKVLRAGGSLSDANVASGGVLERLKNRLGTAASQMRLAFADMPKYRKNSDVGYLIDECAEALEELEKARK